MEYIKDSNYKRIIHSKEWTTVRNKYIKEHPVCQYPGCMHLAEEVHHKIPLNRFRTNFDKMLYMATDENNLESLCHEHHNIRHKELNKAGTRDMQGINKERVAAFVSNWFCIEEDEK